MNKNKKDKIAILGGGPMGLAVAYELCLHGYKPTLFEADDRLGGMAASFNFGGIDIERYYHFHCLNDYDFFELCKELNIFQEIEWRETKMGFFFKKKLYKWGTISSVLLFPHLSLTSKLRYLLHAARCLTLRNWDKLDKIKATLWIKKWLGRKNYKILWEALFQYKFFNYRDDISAAWIWSRINRLARSRKNLKENIGFLKGGSKVLIESLEDKLRSFGCKINCKSLVKAIKPLKSGGAQLIVNNKKYTFDKVITTCPLPIISSIFRNGGVENKIVNKYASQKSVACACVIIQTKKAITENFWTNINDERFKIPGIIEVSNLRPIYPHITYIPFYMPFDNKDYIRPDDIFIKDSWNCLKTINPHLKDDDLVVAKCNRYKFAQPVCGTNFKKKLPQIEPFKGIFTVDTTAYYPEDRGISESIKFGRTLVKQILKNSY